MFQNILKFINFTNKSIKMQLPYVKHGLLKHSTFETTEDIFFILKMF